MTTRIDQTPAPPNIRETEQVWAGRKIFQALFGAVKAAMVYEANNRAYRSRADELGGLIRDYLQCYGGLRLDYFNDFFFVDGVRLKYGTGEFSHDRELATLFEGLRLGGLAFTSAPDVEQLDRAVFALAQIDRKVDDPYRALEAAWQELQLAEITIRRMAPKISNRLSTDQKVLSAEHLRKRRAGAVFFRAIDLLRDFNERIRDTGSFTSAKAQRVVHDLVDHIVKDETSLLEFTAIKDFDDYTFAHSTNVCIYAIALGLRLGLDRRRLSELGFAALFHDVGKVKLPQDLINKPEEYSEDDWRMIQKHPVLGALTLGAMLALDDHHARGVLVAYEHHRSVDGGGYPPSPEPRPLNLFSRIVAVADSYDAMTSGRVYLKTRVSPDEALRRLLGQFGARYDPIVLRAFVHVLGIFPVGTFVCLSTGELGIVSRNDQSDLFRPDVRVLREADGSQTAERTVKLTTTDAETGRYLSYIAEVLPPDGVDFTVRQALDLPVPASDSTSTTSVEDQADFVSPGQRPNV